MLKQAIVQYDLDMAMHRIAIDESLATAELADLTKEQQRLIFFGAPHEAINQPHGDSANQDGNTANRNKGPASD